MTDIEAAQMVVDLYAWNDGDPFGGFDFIEPGEGDHGICWASKRVDGVDEITLRGSRKFIDWIRDFIALANPFAHGTLGPVHPGFLIGMPECWREIQARTKGPWKLKGHSLGAGRGRILQGLMKASGTPPLDCVFFGEPKPGFAHLGAYLQGMPSRSYRNGDSHHFDLVTAVPLTVPPEEYVHPVPLIEICAAPPLLSRLGPFSWHHMALYLKALQTKL